MIHARVDLALRLDTAVRRLTRGRRCEELTGIAGEIRAALLAPAAVQPFPAPADPLAAFIAAAEAAREAGISAPELIAVFNDVLESCAGPVSFHAAGAR